MTGINVTLLHPDADSWRAKFFTNLSLLIQLKPMVILKKQWTQSVLTVTLSLKIIMILEVLMFQKLCQILGGDWAIKLPPTRKELPTSVDFIVLITFKVIFQISDCIMQPFENPLSEQAWIIKLIY